MNEVNMYFSDDAPTWLKEMFAEVILQAQEKMAKENTADTSSDEQNSTCEEQLSEKENGENMPTKHQLLGKYLNKPVTAFKQYDCFTDTGPDCVFQPDKDGDCLFGGNTTHELMHGTSIRVLIRPNESKKDVVTVLLKIAEWINRDDKFKNKAEYEDEDDLPF